MKLYLIPSTGEWLGTQADAKAAAREVGCDFDQLEVPTDKTGLLEFLNRHQVGQLEDLPDRGGFAAPVPAKQDPTDWITADAPEDAVLSFIFDKADGRAIERIFEALGTRFHEMQRASK